MVQINSPTPDATTGSKGKVQLAGDLGGTAALPSVLKVAGVTVSGTPTSANYLRGDGVWSTPAGGGGGDMLLAGTQTNTGAKTFNPNTLIAAGSTSGTTNINANAVAGSGTVILPTTGTLATLAGVETLTNKTLTSPAITTPTGIVKGDVGLGNVDNTADTAKPVSTAQQTALDGKVNTGTSPTNNQLIAFSDSTGVNIKSAGISFGNVMTLNTAQTATGAKTFNANNLITAGSTSGTTTLNASAVAGTTTLTLPAATDTLVGLATTDTLTNKNLTSGTNTFPTFNQNTTGTSSNVTGTVAVANGGTGRATSTTAYGLIAAGTTATGVHQTLATGATTDILVSGGSGALPVWTTAVGSGAPVRANGPSISSASLTTPTVTSTGLSISGSTSGAATLRAQAVAGTAVATLPLTSDTLVGRDTTDTLTNKTLTAPVIGGTVTGTYTIGGTPTFPSTVVLTTGTQTLTGKTLAAASNTITGLGPSNMNWPSLTLHTYSNTATASPGTTEAQTTFPTSITFTLTATQTVEITTQCYVTTTITGMRLMQYMHVTNTAGAVVAQGSFNAPGGTSWGDQGVISMRAVLVGLTAGSYTYIVTDQTSSSTATTSFRTAIARIIG